MWAPRGRTPVLRHCFNWKKLSICSALAFGCNGKRSRLFFQIVSESFNDEKLIVFLSAMLAEFKGKKVTLVWDGLPSHRSRRMTQYLQGQRKRLSVTRLPSYAPDIKNPPPEAVVFRQASKRGLGLRALSLRAAPCPPGIERSAVSFPRPALWSLRSSRGSRNDFPSMASASSSCTF